MRLATEDSIWHPVCRRPARDGTDGPATVTDGMNVAPILPIRTATEYDDEERLVAELDGLGISYLSRRAPVHAAAWPPRSPRLLIGDLLGQRSARVRLVIVALLLARPDLWPDVRAVHGQLAGRVRHTLMLYYTAAMFLQRLHAARLEQQLGASFEFLPDLFGDALGIDCDLSPEVGLRVLAQTHSRLTGSELNWEGTYRSVAERLLRQWQLEARWRS